MFLFRSPCILRVGGKRTGQVMAAEAQRDAEELEADIDAVIESCGGDPRAAIRALILASAYWEAECDRLAAALSVGFTYGKFRQAPGSKALP